MFLQLDDSPVAFNHYKKDRLDTRLW